MKSVSIGLPHSPSVVGCDCNHSHPDLPQLQYIKLGRASCALCRSVVLESRFTIEVTMQTCQDSNPFNYKSVPSKVIGVTIERRLMMSPITTGTHWQWKVRVIERMNKQIFPLWLYLEGMETISDVSVRWFSRVVIWCLTDVDIPQLVSSCIKFVTGGLGDHFYYTYSLQSSSTHACYSMTIRCGWSLFVHPQSKQLHSRCFSIWIPAIDSFRANG